MEIFLFTALPVLVSTGVEYRGGVGWGGFPQDIERPDKSKSAVVKLGVETPWGGLSINLRRFEILNCIGEKNSLLHKILSWHKPKSLGTIVILNLNPYTISRVQGHPYNDPIFKACHVYNHNVCIIIRLPAVELWWVYEKPDVWLL